MPIDRYAYRNNLVDKNPIYKVAISFFIMMISITSENIYIQSGIIFIISTIIVYTSDMSTKEYLKIIFIPAGFLVMGLFAIMLAVSIESTNMIAHISLGKFYIGITDYGIENAKYTFFRSASVLSSVYFLMLTTPFNQIIYIMKKLRIPDIVIELSMLIYRFIFIFMEETSEIYKNQELRFGYMGLKNSYRSIGILVGTIYKRIMDRYDEMSIALDMKLFDGTFHIGDEYTNK